MVYERTLKGIGQLRAELEGLEVDSGIRASGKSDGTRCLFFITRTSGVFTLWVRPSKGEGGGEFRRFKDVKPLMDYLTGMIDRPVVAKVY